MGRRGLVTPGRGDRSTRAGMGDTLKAGISLNGSISQGSPPGHSEVEGRQWDVYEETSVPSLGSTYKNDSRFSSHPYTRLNYITLRGL